MAFTKKTVRDIDVDGKRVLVRVDFNVPIKDGVVGDTTRIKAALPTINYLVEHNASRILMSHLGRPEGTGFQPELSLEPVAKKLAELSGLDVAFVADTYGEKAAEAVAAVEPGKVLVLETSASISVRRRTIPRSPRSSLPMVTSSFSMPSAPLTAPRVPSWAPPLTCLPRRLPAREGGRHADRHLRRARAPLRRHPSAVPRFPPRSAFSITSSTLLTP